MLSHGVLFSNTNAVEEITLPDIPPCVDLDDLDKDLNSLPADEVARLNAMHLPDGRYSKKTLNTKTTIAVINGVIHAIHKYEIGHGAFGAVKASRNTQTNSWEACKISTPDMYTTHECKMLEKANLLAVKGNYKKNKLYHQSEEFSHSKTSIFMHYVRGDILENTYFKHRPAHQIIKLIIQLLNLTKNLLKQGMIHKDLNKKNIIYDYLDNTLHAIDFGISRLVYDDAFTDLIRILGHIRGYCELNPWLKDNLLPYVNVVAKSYDDGNSTAHEVENVCAKLIDKLSSLTTLLPEDEKKYIIGIIDISDYLNGTNSIYKLSTFSEVWLIDKKNEATKLDYINCRQRFQNNNVWIGNIVFKHSSLAKLQLRLIEFFQIRYPDCHCEFYSIKKDVDYREFFGIVNKNATITPDFSFKQ